MNLEKAPRLQVYNFTFILKSSLNVDLLNFLNLLPPGNEVWGKVIFLHQFVILFAGGACVVAPRGGVCGCSWGGAWFYSGGMYGFIQGGCTWFYSGCMHGLFGGACVVLWGYMCGFIWGACMVLFRGHAWFFQGACMVFLRGGMHGFFSFFRIQWDTVNERVATHPTGMHSCLFINVQIHINRITFSEYVLLC